MPHSGPYPEYQSSIQYPVNLKGTHSREGLGSMFLGSMFLYPPPSLLGSLGRECVKGLSVPPARGTPLPAQNNCFHSPLWVKMSTNIYFPRGPDFKAPSRAGVGLLICSQLPSQSLISLGCTLCSPRRPHGWKYKRRVNGGVRVWGYRFHRQGSRRTM